MIQFFKNKNTFQQPFVLLFALVIKSVYLLNPAAMVPPTQSGGLLSQAINQWVIPGLSPMGYTGLCIALMAISAVYANGVLQSSRMFSGRHSLAAVTMLLFTSLFPQSNFQLPALAMVPLTIAIFHTMVRFYNKPKGNRLIFNAGLLAGLGGLLYHPFVFAIPFVFAGLTYMRPFVWREWLLALLGLLTPYYFAYSIDFLLGHLSWTRHLPQFSFFSQPFIKSWFWWLAIGSVVIWFFVAFVGWQRQLGRMLIQGRKSWYTLLILGLFLLPALFFPSGNHFAALALLSFPLGSFLAHAFTAERITLELRLFFWILLIVAAIVAYGWQMGMV